MESTRYSRSTPKENYRYPDNPRFTRLGLRLPRLSGSEIAAYILAKHRSAVGELLQLIKQI